MWMPHAYINSIQLLQPQAKFIGKADIPLDHGLGSLPSLETPPLLLNDGTGPADLHDGNVIQKFYRASLILKDYITNVLISLVVQMNLVTNKTTGSSKVCYCWGTVNGITVYDFAD